MFAGGLVYNTFNFPSILIGLISEVDSQLIAYLTNSDAFWFGDWLIAYLDSPSILIGLILILFSFGKPPQMLGSQLETKLPFEGPQNYL